METQLSQAEIASTPWKVVTKNHDYVLATWNEIVAVIWRHETTLEAVRQLDEAVAELVRSHPKGIGMLTVVAEGAPLPPSAARKAIADLLTGKFGVHSMFCRDHGGLGVSRSRRAQCRDGPHYTNVLPRATGRALGPNTVRAAIHALRRQMLP